MEDKYLNKDGLELLCELLAEEIEESACSATTVYLNKAIFDRGTYTSAFGNKCTKLYLSDSSQTLDSVRNASMMATGNAKTIYVKDASKHSGLSYTNITYAYA